MRSLKAQTLWMMVCALVTSAAMGAAPTTRIVNQNAPAPASRPVGRSIPGISAQQQAQTKIKQIFATDYQDTSFNARRALARRLIEASEQTQFDWDAKFVLLSEARDLAAGIGDVTTAFEAIDRQAEAFPIIKLHARAEAMRISVPSLSSPPSNLAAVSICMDLLDQCMVEGDYDRADMLLTLASGAARRGKSKPHVDWTESRARILRPIKDAWEIARPAQAALSRAPNDPAASLVMGKFLTFIKGDFDAGLVLLAKCSDTELSTLAKLDLNTEPRPPAQLKTANAWWDLGATQPGDYQQTIRRRAAFWYRKSLSGLDGLDRALAQRRLQELNPPQKPADKPQRPPDALKLTKHWYRVSIAEVNWETAQRLCQEYGGQLVSVETRAEGELMIKLAKNRVLWLGASTDGQGKWSWLSNGEFFYSNWSAGEPASATTEHHPLTGPTGAWRTSTGKAGFICEWSE